MIDDAFADDAAEIHRYGIADESAEHLELDGFAFWDERVILRKSLQDGSFPER